MLIIIIFTNILESSLKQRACLVCRSITLLTETTILMRIPETFGTPIGQQEDTAFRELRPTVCFWLPQELDVKSPAPVPQKI